MKIQLVCLLLVLLCSSQVFALKCHVCSGPDDQDCKNLVTCPSSSQYCMTVVSAETLTRTCQDVCEEDDFTVCCSEDGCA